MTTPQLTPGCDTAWVYLLLADPFELGWALGLKYTQWFTHLALIGLALFAELADAGRLA